MTNDPTTADGNSHPGMMGDGTEEQNLNQRGNPSARITNDEVQAAFGGGNGKTGTVAAEARSFKQKAKAAVSDAKDMADDYYDEASEIVDDRISALTDRIAVMRDQVQQSAEAARDWAMRQADAAKQTAQDKPMLVLSVGAGVAMAVGLMAGFVIGRATADYEY